MTFQTIGMDEAGYGPNLGPLVVGLTAWDLPTAPQECNLRKVLADVIRDVGDKTDKRLLIADSKQVYSPQRGLAKLELGVLACLGTLGIQPDTLRDLWLTLAGPNCSQPDEEPWFADYEISLPVAARPEDILATTAALNAAFDKTGARLRDVRLDLVLGQRFNRLVREANSKGICLSQTTMNLLASFWDCENDDLIAQVIGDKHGGRNRYSDLIAEIVDGRMIFTLEESREKSSYRVGNTHLTFRTRAEAYLPVALASMCAKYLRELSMQAFNAFWQEHNETLKPTKGYPQDAKRFRKEIASTQKALAISDDMLWRAR